MMTYWENIIQLYTGKYNKVSADIKKEFNSESVYNKKFLKTKIRSYGDEATDFHDKEIPKAGSDCTCLAIITIDSVFEKEEFCDLLVFLK